MWSDQCQCGEDRWSYCRSSADIFSTWFFVFRGALDGWKRRRRRSAVSASWKKKRLQRLLAWLMRAENCTLVAAILAKWKAFSKRKGVPKIRLYSNPHPPDLPPPGVPHHRNIVDVEVKMYLFFVGWRRWRKLAKANPLSRTYLSHFMCLYRE